MGGRKRFTGALGAVALVALACGSAGSSGRAATGADIVIGVPLSITGSQSKEGALALRVFSKGSVGAQVRVSLDVANEEGDEFSLSGQVLLTIPETVVK